MRVNSGALALTLLAAVAGVAISGYLTVVHYRDVPLVCSSDGLVDCHTVLTSSYASVAGIPWSVGGILWFTVSGLLAAVALARRPEPEAVQPLQLAWGLLSLATVLYLVGVEVLAVNRICLWCSVLHVLIVLTFAVNLFRTPLLEEAKDEERGDRLLARQR